MLGHLRPGLLPLLMCQGSCPLGCQAVGIQPAGPRRSTETQFRAHFVSAKKALSDQSAPFLGEFRQALGRFPGIGFLEAAHSRDDVGPSGDLSLEQKWSWSSITQRIYPSASCVAQGWTVLKERKGGGSADRI